MRAARRVRESLGAATFLTIASLASASRAAGTVTTVIVARPTQIAPPPKTTPTDSTTDASPIALDAQGNPLSQMGDSSKCAGDDCPGHEHWDLASIFGLRVSFMSTSVPAAKKTVGVMLAGSSEYYRTDGLFALRSSGIAALGGGSGALEGALGATVAVGIRAPVDPHHGPVARIGLGGELIGNGQFYYSHVDLPLGEVGYQYMNGHTIFEAGARAAPLLVGLYNTGYSYRRELGTSFEWGGYLAAHSSFGRLDMSFVQIQANADPGTPVDVVRGQACAYVSKVVAICIDAMFLHGEEQPLAVVVNGNTSASAITASTFYGGLMGGFSFQ